MMNNTIEQGLVTGIKGATITVHVGETYVTVGFRTKAAAATYIIGQRVSIRRNDSGNWQTA